MTSTIFGEFYTEELWFLATLRFCAGANGNHEASSGCYTAMALLLMSDAGKQLAEREHYRLRRDAQALAQEWRCPLLIHQTMPSFDDDWLDRLVCFHHVRYYHR